MGLPSEQLKAIYQEIQSQFDQHQKIVVTPIAGSPPEQYRVRYRLQGLCKGSNGAIQPCTDHTISVTIPFGFPHFPPSCIPETPVFHPDFDQSAICIGDFWDKNPSLPALILHIGQMICGEVYSTDHAFNAEALAWYQENQQTFPLDTLTSSVPQLVSAPSLPRSESDTDSSSFVLELVDETLFPEQTTTNASPTLSVKSKGDPISPPDTAGADPMDFSHATHQKHQEAEEFEDQGPADNDLDIHELVPDVPGLESDDRPPQAKRKQTNRAVSSLQQQNPPTPASPPSRPVVQSQKQPWRRPVFLAGVGLAALMMTATGIFFFLNGQYTKAQKGVAECQRLVDAKKFKEAEKECAAALLLTSKISLIKQEEKKQLQHTIQQIQDSETFKEGLAQQKENKIVLPEWQQIMTSADLSLTAGQWQEALDLYTRSFKLVTATPKNDPAILKHISDSMVVAEFHIALEAGKQALTTKKWEEATKSLDKALSLTQKNPQIPSADIATANSLKNQITFNTLMISGEKAFAEEEWTNALAFFEQALALEKQSPFASPATLKALNETISKTKIYTAIGLAQQSFADSHWDQAVTHYETAIQLLKDSDEMLQQDSSQQSEQKLARLKLHTSIIRDTQKAATHLKNKEFSPAITLLQAIVTTINASPFAAEQQFQALGKEAKNSLEQARLDQTITEHVAYLTENYKKLFLQNNPTLEADNLSTPKATFFKKTDTTFTYKIQCLEKGQGRPVVLQSTYSFDLATRSWHLATNNHSQ